MVAPFLRQQDCARSWQGRAAHLESTKPPREFDSSAAAAAGGRKEGVVFGAD